MKVLLLDDIEKLGYLGDVVEVKMGYARNYLLPQGLATIPTENAIKSIAKERAARAEERKLARQQLEGAFAEVEGASVTIVAKANEQGHLFGSVAEKDIAEDLRNQGLQVATEMVKMDHHIKEVGEHKVNLRFAADLVQPITVTVLSEDAEQQAQEQEEGEPVEQTEETAQSE